MSILIKGMEMPDYGYVCLKVFANGEVLMTKENRGALVITGIKDKVGTAVSVPPHGDLIDLDALMLRINMHGTNKFGMLDEDIRRFVADAPTIIPAIEEVET